MPGRNAGISESLRRNAEENLLRKHLEQKVCPQGKLQIGDDQVSISNSQQAEQFLAPEGPAEISRAVLALCMKDHKLPELP